MARSRKRKMVAAEYPMNLIATSHNGNSAQQFMDRQMDFNHRELECQIAAIQAIQVTEKYNIITCLRVLRSNFSKKELETPALKFFQEYLPNLLAVRNDKSKVSELWQIEKKIQGQECSSLISSNGDPRFSLESVRHSFLNAASLPIPNFVPDGALDTQMSQMLSVGDAFQTPGGTNNRLSFGMTPKTSRLPKPGEMLLSVHGSPLGVYKEDALEAIQESGDGSESRDGSHVLYDAEIRI